MKNILSYPGCHEVRSTLSEFSEVSTREECGGTIHLGIIREESQILCGLILLLQVIFYSLPTLLDLKGKIVSPF